MTEKVKDNPCDDDPGIEQEDARKVHKTPPRRPEYANRNPERPAYESFEDDDDDE